MRARITRAKAMSVVALAFGLASPLAAEDGRRWLAYAGSFNFDQEVTAAEAGLELRFPSPWQGFSWVGGATATERSSFWAYGGVQYAWRFAERWAIGPGLAAALYERGDGKDLGSTFHFRSNLEVSAAVSERSRIAVAVYHLSNGGLTEHNPGSNSLVLSWSSRLGG